MQNCHNSNNKAGKVSFAISPNLNILEQARQSAANTLIPMLQDMGFAEENIKISFRKKFTFNDLKTLLDKTTIEKNH